MLSNKIRAWRGFAVAGAVAGAMSIASAARAGECPADQMRVDATKPATHAAKDVTDTLLAATQLGEFGIDGRQLRLRRLEIKPGGIVPWHSHADRPALIIVLEGEVVEYASNCAVPIVHKAGEVSKETKAVSHWWKNNGTKTVVLLSADILRDANDKNM